MSWLGISQTPTTQTHRSSNPNCFLSGISVARRARSGLRKRSGAGREYQDKAPQISVVFPLISCTLKTPVGGGATVKTTRPTMSVVEGPGGLSVGKRIRTLCPVSVSVYEPSGFIVRCATAPLDGVVKT